MKQNVSKWVALLIVVLLLGGLLAYVLSNRIEGDDDGFSKTPVTTNAVIPTNTTSNSYKNGTYSAVGTYDSPAGIDTMDVSLTLNEGIVTAVTITPKGIVPASKRWFEKFNAGVSPFVIGKKINELNLTQVSGASLTPIGFNDALEKIKIQAKI